MKKITELENVITAKTEELESVKRQLTTARAGLGVQELEGEDTQYLVMAIERLENREVSLAAGLVEADERLAVAKAAKNSPEYKAAVRRSKAIIKALPATAESMLKELESLLAKVEKAASEGAELRQLEYMHKLDLPSVTVSEYIRIIESVRVALLGLLVGFQHGNQAITKKAGLPERRQGYVSV